MVWSGPMSLEECLEQIRSGQVPRNEESAKFQVIAPVLRSLDWNPEDGSEFLLEHSVGGKGGGRVDIALRSDGRVVALIEAKAPHADLNGHVTQVLNYAFHEGVDICVLTTGLEWWLFLPREAGEPMRRRFAVLDLINDPVERIAEDLRAFLHKETLLSGQAETKAKLVLKASLEAARLSREIPDIWKRMLKDPDEELVELLGKRVYAEVDLRPTEDQVVAVLRGLPVPLAGIPDKQVDVPKTSKPLKPEAKKTQKRPRPTQKPVAILLWGTRHSVSSHKEILQKVADLLHEKHSSDFDKMLRLRGRKFPYVARDPESLQRDSYYQVMSSDYFIDTHLGARDIRRRAELFLSCFGYDSSDLDVLFD